MGSETTPPVASEVFIVVKEGMYRHDIHGPFCSEGEAVGAADRIAAADIDSYHSYEVYLLNGTLAGGTDSLYTTQKGRATPTTGRDDE